MLPCAVSRALSCNLLGSFHDTLLRIAHKKYRSMSVMWTSYVYCINWSSNMTVSMKTCRFCRFSPATTNSRRVTMQNLLRHHFNQSGHGNALRLTPLKIILSTTSLSTIISVTDIRHTQFNVVCDVSGCLVAFCNSFTYNLRVQCLSLCAITGPPQLQAHRNIISQRKQTVKHVTLYV